MVGSRGAATEERDWTWGSTTVFLTFTDAERAKAYAEYRCYSGLHLRDLWVFRSRPLMVSGESACEIGFEFHDQCSSKGIGTIYCTKLADMFLREVGVEPRKLDRFRLRVLKAEDLGIVSYRITGEQSPTFGRSSSRSNHPTSADPSNEPTSRMFFRRSSGDGGA